MSFRGGKLKSHGLIQKRSLTKKAESDAKKRKVKSPNRLKRSDTMQIKYGARKTVVDGIMFDSNKEAQRYRELKLLEKAGKIADLQLQVPFELIPAQYEATDVIYTKGANKGKPKRGKLIERAVTYYADFLYVEIEQFPDIRTVSVRLFVEDVKGCRTKDYIIKRKLFRWRYPEYEFREV